MRDRLHLKVWAGPLTIGSFALVAVTGILMFFHAAFGQMKLAHEWIGWLLVAAAVAHLVVNWKPFLAYLKKPAALLILGVFVVLGALSMTPTSGQSGPPPYRVLGTAMQSSSLEVVAQVVKKDVGSVTDQLTAHGIQVRDSEQTIEEIASENQVRGMAILAYILEGSGPAGQGWRLKTVGRRFLVRS